MKLNEIEKFLNICATDLESSIYLRESENGKKLRLVSTRLMDITKTAKTLVFKEVIEEDLALAEMVLKKQIDELEGDMK